MVQIRKDPEELPDDVVNFQEVFSDINSPEIWISQSDEDMKPALIVLDGHSTVIIYDKETEELNWEAYYEMGNYEYIPKNIGDGMISFPHTFYFEFIISLSDKKLEVNANFDGNGIRAVVMPFKDVNINDFFSAFKDRLSDTFSSVLRPNDDQLDIKEGEVLSIPKSLLDQLSLKLAFMGVNLDRLKVTSIIPIEVKEGEMVEGVFEAPPKMEKKEEKAAPKSAKRTKVSTPPSKGGKAPASPPPSTGAGGGGSAPAPPPTVKPTSPAPTPTPKKVTSEPPSPGKMDSAPPSPSGPPTPTSMKSGPPPPTSGPSGPPSPGGRSAGPPPPKSSPPSAPPGPTSRSRSASAPAEEMMMEDLDEESDEMERISDSLLPKELTSGAPQTEQLTLKHTHAQWYEKMIPNKVYDLNIKISTEKIQARRSSSNIVTGEKRSETTSTMIVDESSMVTVRPEFPGCIVVPPSKMVDMDKDTVEVKFHITPLAMGDLDARVVFEQNSKIIHFMQLESKVIKHRVTQISTTIGALTAVLPAIIGFFFGLTPNEFIDSRLELLNLTFFLGWGYLFPILIAGLSGLVGLGAYIWQKPTTNDKSVSFSQ